MPASSFRWPYPYDTYRISSNAANFAQRSDIASPEKAGAVQAAVRPRDRGPRVSRILCEAEPRYFAEEPGDVCCRGWGSAHHHIPDPRYRDGRRRHRLHLADL